MRGRNSASGSLLLRFRGICFPIKVLYRFICTVSKIVVILSFQRGNPPFRSRGKRNTVSIGTKRRKNFAERRFDFLKRRFLGGYFKSLKNRME